MPISLWGGGDVPVGVGNFRVPDVSRDGIGHMIDSVVLLAAQQCLTDEGMAQIVDSGLRMSAARNPAQASTQNIERVVNRSLGNRPASRE